MSNSDLAKTAEKFCPRCAYFQRETGVCKKFYFNVREYPSNFIKKCNGNYFKEDTTKALQETERLEAKTDNHSEQSLTSEQRLQQSTDASYFKSSGTETVIEKFNHVIASNNSSENSLYLTPNGLYIRPLPALTILDHKLQTKWWPLIGVGMAYGYSRSDRTTEDLLGLMVATAILGLTLLPGPVINRVDENKFRAAIISGEMRKMQGQFIPVSSLTAALINLDSVSTTEDSSVQITWANHDLALKVDIKQLRELSNNVNSVCGAGVFPTDLIESTLEKNISLIDEFRKETNPLPQEVNCDFCKKGIKLNESQRVLKKFECAHCDRTSDLFSLDESKNGSVFSDLLNDGAYNKSAVIEDKTIPSRTLLKLLCNMFIKYYIEDSMLVIMFSPLDSFVIRFLWIAQGFNSRLPDDDEYVVKVDTYLKNEYFLTNKCLYIKSREHDKYDAIELRRINTQILC